jgi:hypothetical protein
MKFEPQTNEPGYASLTHSYSHRISNLNLLVKSGVTIFMLNVFLLTSCVTTDTFGPIAPGSEISYNPSSPLPNYVLAYASGLSELKVGNWPTANTDLLTSYHLYTNSATAYLIMYSFAHLNDLTNTIYYGEIAEADKSTLPKKFKNEAATVVAWANQLVNSIKKEQQLSDTNAELSKNFVNHIVPIINSTKEVGLQHYYIRQAQAQYDSEVQQLSYWCGNYKPIHSYDPSQGNNNSLFQPWPPNWWPSVLEYEQRVPDILLPSN